MAADSFILERFHGIWSRNMVVGVTFTEMLISQLIIQISFMSLQTINVLVVPIFTYKIYDAWSVLILYFVLMVHGLTYTCVGGFLAMFCKSMTALGNIFNGFLLPFAVLGGTLRKFKQMQ